MRLIDAVQRPTVKPARWWTPDGALNAIPGPVQKPVVPVGRTSGFARVAEAIGQLSDRRADILCQLLRTTCTPADDHPSPLAPIWGLENIVRARLTIRLLAALDRLRATGSPHMLSLDMERDAADRLCAGLGLLRDLSTARPVPCSALLRHVVRDLVELFGPVIGDVRVVTQIERVSMPNVKRRALVLAVCNVLLHAMADGFAGRRTGTLLVSLHRVDARHVCLTVADDGGVAIRDWADETGDVVEDLTAVLDGRVVQRRDGRGGVAWELTCPA